MSRRSWDDATWPEDECDTRPWAWDICALCREDCGEGSDYDEMNGVSVCAACRAKNSATEAEWPAEFVYIGR